MSANIDELEPLTKSMCQRLLADARALGLEIRVTWTYRSDDEQLHLWAQGRSLRAGVWVVIDKTKIVTNAMPGSSAHNHRMGFDICFTGHDPYLHAYEVEHGTPDPRWKLLGQLGTSLGLNWGGPLGARDRFTFDSPHFERADWRHAAGLIPA